MKSMNLARRDRGIGLAVVILLVLVTMILCFVAVAMWARRAELNTEKKRLQALKTTEAAAAETIRRVQDEGAAPTGLAPSEGTALSGETSADAVKKGRDVLFAAKPGDPPVPEFVGAFREDQFSTYQALLNEAANRVAHLLVKFQRADNEAKLAKAYLDAKQAARPEILKDRQQYKDRLQALIMELNTRITAVTTQYNETKGGLTAQIDKLKADIELAEAEFRDFERKESGKIKKMQNDLEQMKQKEIIKHRVNVAHGQVLKPDVAQQNAFINLGSRERVVPGLRFMAARWGTEGKLTYKALLEVKKVWLETSEVAIVKAYPGGGPVIDGDMIVNPFFNPRRPVIVAFAGHTGDRAFNLRMAENNPKPLRLSAREAANRIKEIGSDPRMNVTLDADFVLFTEVTSDMSARDSWPDYKKAVLLEIPLADAADYYEFLGG